jgi:hypothetical protein
MIICVRVKSDASQIESTELTWGGGDVFGKCMLNRLCPDSPWKSGQVQSKQVKPICIIQPSLIHN